jgi:hypothetical protein
MNPVPYSTRCHIWFQRSVRWEFWPWQIVYFPVAVYWFILAIKAKGWVFFSAANPAMRFGGFVAYSKSEALKLVPISFLPKTIYLTPPIHVEAVVAQLAQHGMTYPLIIKPDMGERGKGVRILHSAQDLVDACKVVTERMLLQVFEDLPMEFGVLYTRHPNEDKGVVTSVVIKEFPSVTGDGSSTLLQLILHSERTRFNYKRLVAKHASKLNEVPAKGEEIRLVKLGNHILGATFLNGNHLIGPQLNEVFDALAKQLPGFFVGRFDVRAASVQELLAGHFKVIEVNGVNSEPAHIYDPNYSIFTAWKDLFRHWNRLAKIAMANHRNGVPYASFSEIRAEIRRHNREGAKHH